ncbi:hypothetical protein AKG95_29200 (plasmid) [Janthinobacterium lividum]|jgi:hypothetical protein|uniref:Uncharacterized protein n=1 Tax=Janthinobacterium lividum TaxID=29581 RepID=A0A1S1U148_9BURK|nr:hypothetical protein [Janthinobacterium lividum]MCL6485666.1 hypothetical protein [Janthinobacterium lividum]OHV93809.1 hypothetical protein AKG95_29200 [Janthinobacterium lividum]
MQIFNATPPADFPAQVIVAHDAKFAASHPNDVYWLRVKGDGADVRAHQLTGAIGPGHARQIARTMGFEPTHWTLPGDGRAYLF